MGKIHRKCKYCRIINPAVHLCSQKSEVVTDKDCEKCLDYEGVDKEEEAND